MITACLVIAAIGLLIAVDARHCRDRIRRGLCVRCGKFAGFGQEYCKEHRT